MEEIKKVKEEVIPTEDFSINNNLKRLEEYDNIFKFKQSDYYSKDIIYEKDDVLRIKYNKIKELNPIESILEYNITNTTRDYIKKISIVKVIKYLTNNNIVVKYIGGKDETLEGETFLISADDIYIMQGKSTNTKIINNTIDINYYLSRNIDDSKIHLRLFKNNTVTEVSVFNITTDWKHVILDGEGSCKSRKIITVGTLLRYLNSCIGYKSLLDVKINIIGIHNCKLYSITKCNDSDVIYFDCIEEEK